MTAEDKRQSECFKETARELGLDLDEDKLKEALRQMAKPEKPKEES